MDNRSPVLVITTNEGDRGFYNQLAISLGYGFANVFVGGPYDAALAVAQAGYSVKYLVIDVGSRSMDVLPELDKLAEQCDMDARVLVLGTTNDINFYREIISRGVLEYLTHPVRMDAIRAVFFQKANDVNTKLGKVIAFMGAGAGDGSSTIAINVSYAIATSTKKKTVLVDLDYQFGMVARNLDIPSQYGIRDAFDHPERGIDTTLIDRMVVNYNEHLDIISAPSNLQYMPAITADLVRDMVQALRLRYDFVVLDVPHLWNHWVSAALISADHIVLVGQLWLKSVTHSARFLAMWRSLGIQDSEISIVINRSGSKFKEAMNPKDFERVSGHKISFYVSNDIKTIVKAENRGATIIEEGSSALASQITQMAEELLNRLNIDAKSKQKMQLLTDKKRMG
jgi:pilus assembly protein CpaE